MGAFFRGRVLPLSCCDRAVGLLIDRWSSEESRGKDLLRVVEGVLVDGPRWVNAGEKDVASGSL